MYSAFIIIGFYFRKNIKLNAVFLKVMGRPRKDKKINNAEKCRKYCEKKDRESYLQKDKERKQKKRAELKNNPVIQEALRENDRIRKRKALEIAASKQVPTHTDAPITPTTTAPATPSTSTASTIPTTPTAPTTFSTKASLQRSVKRARCALPKSPQKNLTVIQHLVQELTPHKNQEDHWH